MNVYLAPQYGLSRAMDRVAKALHEYAPSDVTIVPHEGEADLVVLHVIGYPETQAAVARLKAAGKKYAIVQYCIRSTQIPHALLWCDSVWAGAELVWSYYDLQAMLHEEWAGCDLGSTSPTPTIPNFYLAPLGVDHRLFSLDIDRAVGFQRPYTILTSGYVAEPECVGEVAAAVKAVDGFQFHLGPDLALDGNVVYSLGIPDTLLSAMYKSSRFVSGLRRQEGFELPAAEGLCCGARPILFDRPHYRQWFSEWGIFIPEGTPAEVQASLEAVFRDTTIPPVNALERKAASDRFSWPRIVAGFWDRVAREVNPLTLIGETF